MSVTTRAPSADDRENAVARLSAAFANDELSLEEFEHRVAEVYRAPSLAALAKLLADVRGVGPDTGSAGGRALVTAAPMSPRLAVAFGRVERGGRVAVPPRVDLRAAFGHLELDLREAEFGPGITEICIHAVVATVAIRLPPGVAVENSGRSMVGSFAARVKRGPRAAYDLARRVEPVVRLTGRALLGKVEVEREARRE